VAVHPIERLRYVARAGSVDAGELVREAAGALGGMGSDPTGLVLSCKRLVDRQPTAGPLWWLCARMLAAADPRAEAWRCVDELDEDPTGRRLADELPDEARVTVLGWPELVGEALPRRGDLEVLVVDAAGEGTAFARRLRGADVDAEDVPEGSTAGAAVASDVVVLEPTAMGAGRLLAPAGSLAAAAVARYAGVPVWAVAGAGRALPGPLWEALVGRLDLEAPWEADVELVPLDLVDVVLGPGGRTTADRAATRADCGVAAELLEREG
jgi:hypothetical protein